MGTGRHFIEIHFINKKNNYLLKFLYNINEKNSVVGIGSVHALAAQTQSSSLVTSGGSLHSRFYIEIIVREYTVLKSTLNFCEISPFYPPPIPLHSLKLNSKFRLPHRARPRILLYYITTMMRIPFE